MARSTAKTWLSLDRWFEIMGIHPFNANQLSSTLKPNTVCGDVLFQYDWQHSDRIGRETIGRAIQEAEFDIAQMVGYNLMPDWIIEERLAYPNPGVPEMYGIGGLNPRLQYKSVELNRGHVISGGIKTKTLVQAGVAFARTDDDVDGYAETCTAIVATALTDAGQFHLYYPAKSGSDEWEIRPIKVAISGGFATITWKSWQIVAANQMDDINPDPLNADLAGTYETTVDVYRIYNDVSTQAQFMWENDPSLQSCGSCAACEFGTQAGCFHLRDPRLGLTVPVPASYSASAGTWSEQSWSVCREPDQIRFWYYSGFRDLNQTRPYADLAPYWEYPVAYFAAAKLDRPVCGCSNVSEFIQRWRRDAAFSSMEEGGWTMTPEMASNKLGTTMGALAAYRAIMKPGIRVIK